VEPGALAGQLEVRFPGHQLGTLDGQRGRDVTAPGVHGGKPAGTDPREQGGDLEDQGKPELDGGRQRRRRPARRA
jgi:hypothetical protein